MRHEREVTPGRIAVSSLMLILGSRLAFFVIFQMLIAGGLAAAGGGGALAQVGRMVADRRRAEQYPVARDPPVPFTRAEDLPLYVAFEWNGGGMKRDLPLLAGVLLLMGPAALITNLVLAHALFSHSGDGLALLVQPISMWAAVIGLVAFPLTMAVAELPIYYGLILPRLQETWSNRWIALCVVVAWHAAQHVALPLIFDVRFITWRFFTKASGSTRTAWGHECPHNRPWTVTRRLTRRCGLQIGLLEAASMSAN